MSYRETCFSIPKCAIYFALVVAAVIATEQSYDDVTCVVNGEIYKYADRFVIPDHPELYCVCQPGYTGENIAPFCRALLSNDYNMLMNSDSLVQRRCVPVYDTVEDRSASRFESVRCPSASRFQTDDWVVHTHHAEEKVDEVNVCLFGDLRMHINDELNRNSGGSCTDCYCYFPPMPTCFRAYTTECDERNYDFLHM